MSKYISHSVTNILFYTRPECCYNRRRDATMTKPRARALSEYVARMMEEKDLTPAAVTVSGPRMGPMLKIPLAEENQPFN
jgi:hypothetical protein